MKIIVTLFKSSLPPHIAVFCIEGSGQERQQIFAIDFADSNYYSWQSNVCGDLGALEREVTGKGHGFNARDYYKNKRRRAAAIVVIPAKEKTFRELMVWWKNYDLGAYKLFTNNCTHSVRRFFDAYMGVRFPGKFFWPGSLFACIKNHYTSLNEKRRLAVRTMVTDEQIAFLLWELCVHKYVKGDIGSIDVVLMRDQATLISTGMNFAVLLLETIRKMRREDLDAHIELLDSAQDRDTLLHEVLVRSRAIDKIKYMATLLAYQKGPEIARQRKIRACSSQNWQDLDRGNTLVVPARTAKGTDVLYPL